METLRLEADAVVLDLDGLLVDSESAEFDVAPELLDLMPAVGAVVGQGGTAGVGSTLERARLQHCVDIAMAAR